MMEKLINVHPFLCIYEKHILRKNTIIINIILNIIDIIQRYIYSTHKFCFLLFV